MGREAPALLASRHWLSDSESESNADRGASSFAASLEGRERDGDIDISESPESSVTSRS